MGTEFNWLTSLLGPSRRHQGGRSTSPFCPPTPPRGSGGCPKRPVTPHAAAGPWRGHGPHVHTRRVDPQVFPRPVSAYHQPTWLCHPAQLPLLYRGGAPQDSCAAVGVGRATAGRVGQRRLSRISLSIRLAYAQGHRPPRRGLVCHPLCLAADLPSTVKCPGNPCAISSQALEASGALACRGAAIMALRTGTYGIRSCYFRTGVTDVLAMFARHVWLCQQIVDNTQDAVIFAD